MSVVSPQIFLCEDQLRDLFGAPMVPTTTEGTQNRDRLIGEELVFDGGLTPGHRKCDELPATTIYPNIRGRHLPLHSRHRSVERNNFDHVMQHVALSHTRGQNYSPTGLSRQPKAAGRVQTAMQFIEAEYDLAHSGSADGTRMIVSIGAGILRTHR